LDTVELYETGPERKLLLRQVNILKVVIPGLTRNPVQPWIPAFAGVTVLIFMVAGVINKYIIKS
jgi:hypothetical protein